MKFTIPYKRSKKRIERTHSKISLKKIRIEIVISQKQQQNKEDI